MGPSNFIVPLSSTMPRVQNSCAAEEAWVTKMTVTSSSSMISRTRAKHFSWNCLSPTESASSTTRISGSLETAKAKPRRAFMPEE